MLPEQARRLMIEAGKGDPVWVVFANALFDTFPNEMAEFTKLVAQNAINDKGLNHGSGEH
mgnify:CR=1 FL=1